MTIFFNGSEKPIKITDVLLDATEEYFANEISSKCSSVNKMGSPNQVNFERVVKTRR